MKFLCVACDEPMKLVHTSPPEGGSITALYRCPECAQQTAMLTNPFETQLIRSMGVEIRPGGADAEPGASKCPFSGMIAGLESPADTAESDVAWTDDALDRLSKMPEFIQPMARSGIERFARDEGLAEVTGDVLDRARSHFGM